MHWRKNLVVTSYMVTAAIALPLTGCGSTSSSRFFVLTSKQILPPHQAKSDLSISVGPVRLPKYLDRPQIVTRANDNELRLAEFDRWAEPLNVNVARVLAEDLAGLLATERVSIVARSAPSSTDCRVVVDVTRFDGSLGGEVTLNARWSIYRVDEDVARTQGSTIRTTSKGSDYASLVAAMNQALAELAEQIADAVP